jgi:HD-like signal output (HDOD) protein
LLLIRAGVVMAHWLEDFWSRWIKTRAPVPDPDSLIPPPPPIDALYEGLTPEELPEDAEHYLRALGLEPPAVVPVSAEDEAEDERLSAKVVTHFRANRPGLNACPSLSLKILNLVADPDADSNELNALITRDPALSAAVLRTANSGAFAGKQESTTVREAVTRLGLAEVSRVAGVVAAKSLFNPMVRAEQASFGHLYTALFHHAGATAMGAGWLAMQRRGGHSDRAFLGGMLHDVGKSIGLRSVAALASGAEPSLASDLPRVHRVLKRVHLEIGGEVHQEWNLPAHLTLLCVRHHDANLPADAEFIDVHCVRLVSALHVWRTQPERAAASPDEVLGSARALGLNPFELRSLDTEVRRSIERMSVAAPSSRPRQSAQRASMSR